MHTTDSLPHHSKISFTAKLVALARSRTDIPFATDVARLIDASSLVMDDIAGREHLLENTYTWMAPMVEARYKSLAQALQRSSITQVIEFASGVSLRGLSMTLQNPDLTYIETDLPELTSEKKLLVASLTETNDLRIPAKHHMIAANILEWDDIQKVTSLLDPEKPVAVVHEGLLMYLSHGEKERAAQHIHRILAEFGGIWITPDFAPIKTSQWQALPREGIVELMESIEKRTGRSFAALSFDDDVAIDDFCQRLGFDYTIRPQLDGSYQLTSSGESHLSHEDFSAWTDALKLWELRLRA